jgi:hypothetical protein
MDGLLTFFTFLDFSGVTEKIVMIVSNDDMTTCCVLILCRKNRASGLPPAPDILSAGRHVSNVPQADSSLSASGPKTKSPNGDFLVKAMIGNRNTGFRYHHTNTQGPPNEQAGTGVSEQPSAARNINSLNNRGNS